MGAQYIEGGSIANPVYNLAAQERLLEQPLQRPNPTKGYLFPVDQLNKRTYLLH